MKNKFTSVLGMLFSAVVLLSFSFKDARAQTYCNPSATSSYAYYGINTVKSANGLVNFLNANTGVTTSGHADYTAIDTVEQVQGGAFKIQASATQYALYWAIWIDWNHDGDFTDPGEQVYVSSGSSTSISADITVPYSATATATRLRVIGSANSITGPCMSNYYLEGEDYTVLIDAAPACTGQPNAGTVTGPATLHLCPNMGFTLTDTGATGAGNMTYQWQSRNPSGTGTWTDIAGASNFNLSVPAGITTSTDYRFYVVCNNSSMADTSNAVTVAMNDSSDCYCVIDFSGSSHSGYFGYAFLSSVQTTGGVVNLNNTNTGYNNTGYQDFRNTDTLRVLPGNQITLNPTLGYTYSFTSAGLMAWVDWNHDGDFTDPGENVANVSSQTVTSSYASTFTVPIIAQPGHTTMRIMVYPYEDNFDPCGTTLPSYYWGEAEDYTVMIDSLPGCATITWPSSATASIDHDTLCVSGDVSLDLDTVFFNSGITYQWQKASSATGPWTNIGTTGLIAPPLTVTGVTTNTWYRCQVKCSGTAMLTSSVVSTHVSNPAMASAPTSGTRCGPGTVLLTSSPTSSSSANWYDQPSGSAPLLMNSANYTTYYIPQTTVFYVASSGGTVANTAFVGNYTSALSDVYSGNPLGLLYYGANKHQYIITAAQMNAAGFNAAGYINSLGFQVLGAGDADTLDFSVSIGLTSDANLQSGWHPVTEVYHNTSYTPTAGSVNVYDFTTPFFWDGFSNIVVQTCISIPTNITATPSVDWTVKGNYTNYTSYSMLYYYDYGVYNTSICPTTSFYTSGYSPNIQFGMKELCEGPREPDTAFVTPGPPFAISYDTVICNNTAKPISVSSPLSNYSQGYTWTALDANSALYTDAAGTISYTGGNASTIYFKSAVAGMHRIAVAASNGTAQSDCAAADTADIWVQPGNITIVGMPDTICSGAVNSTSMLQLNPNTGYAQGPYIQWQESADGLTYNNIAGAGSGVTYTTVPLYTAHYYKAEISAVAGICQSPDKYIVVANPVVLSYADSFNCGPGTVTLRATTGGSSHPVWYTSDTATSAIGSGSPFTTPFLAQTDTFYLAASGGANSVPTQVTVGAGASTSTTMNYPAYMCMPFSSLYGGLKAQYLITKDEMNTAGIFGGFITSVSFNQVANSGFSIYDDFTVSMGTTSVTGLTSTFETGMVEVRAPQNYTPTANAWNVLNFDQPFYWDGSSNVIVQVCWSNNTYGSYPYNTMKYDDATFTATHAAFANNASSATVCDGTIPSYVLANLRPQMQFGGFGPCESARQQVIANIYPKPAVDLGSDINECVDSGTVIVLNAGVQPNSPQFKWDNNTTSQIRSINQSGTYSVSVTNSYTCKTSDTINIVLRDNPVVSLGDDTSVCVNTPVTLDAGSDGIQYFWNTGATTQTITVNTPGNYNVLVTNSQGCTVGDTITVNMSGQTPSFDGIMITNNGNHTFTFNALNPQNVIGYDWDFGDGSPHAYSAVPHHTYANDGTYVVTLVSSSSCGSVADSTSAHILGIGDLNLGNNELSVYPNPTKDKATIITKGVKMEKIAIFNVLGQKIYEANADSPYKHVLDLSSVASGVYNITVYTDKGQAVRKLNVLK